MRTSRENTEQIRANNGREWSPCLHFLTFFNLLSGRGMLPLNILVEHIYFSQKQRHKSIHFWRKNDRNRHFRLSRKVMPLVIITKQEILVTLKKHAPNANDSNSFSCTENSERLTRSWTQKCKRGQIKLN